MSELSRPATAAVAVTEAARSMGVTPRDALKLLHAGRLRGTKVGKSWLADAAILRKEGGHLLIEPVRRQGLLALLASLEPIEEMFADPDAGLRPVEDVAL